MISIKYAWQILIKATSMKKLLTQAKTDFHVVLTKILEVNSTLPCLAFCTLWTLDEHPDNPPCSAQNTTSNDVVLFASTLKSLWVHTISSNDHKKNHLCIRMILTCVVVFNMRTMSDCITARPTGLKKPPDKGQ